MACDVCGKTGTRLDDLRDIYKTEDIQQVCPDCGKVIDEHLWKVQRVTGNILRDLMKRFLRERKENKK